MNRCRDQREMRQGEGGAQRSPEKRDQRVPSLWDTLTEPTRSQQVQIRECLGDSVWVLTLQPTPTNLRLAKRSSITWHHWASCQGQERPAKL